MDDQLFDPEAFKGLERAARRLKVSSFRTSLDDARAFYGWTAHKLDILELYMKQYRRVAGNGTYIDGFAGTGQIRVGGTSRAGSAAVAAKSQAFKTMLLYEKPRNAVRLRKWLAENLEPRAAARCTVRAGDCNVMITEDLDARLVPEDRPCFAFLDPNSTQLSWSTVERLATYKTNVRPPDVCKVELWILLNTHHALMRLMPKRKPPLADVLDRWFGSREAWWDLYEGRAPLPFFAQRYADRLEALGYGAAVPRLISDPRTGRPAYYMIHASDHPAAHSFMAWSSKTAGDSATLKQRLPGL